MLTKIKQDKMPNMTPIKNTTVDPETGNVIPDNMGMGPTNSMNDQTAATVQARADSLAIKENRAGKGQNLGAIQTPMTMKGNFKNSSITTAARMFGNVPNPVPSPQQFTDGLRQASADGKLNPEFKKAVDAAPIKAIPVGAIIKGVQVVKGMMDKNK